MMYNLLMIIFSLGLPMLAGYCLLELLFFKKSGSGFLEKLALSFGVGAGVLSLVMFILSLLKIRFTFLNITSTMLIIIIPFLLVLIRSGKLSTYQAKSQVFRLSAIEMSLVGIIILVSLYVFFQALITPLVVWDSWAIYGFKAKAFYLDKIVSTDFLKDPTKLYSHLDYPLLVPLAESWVYISLGSWNDQLVKIIFPIYFIGLAAIFYSSLKYYIDKKLALVFTVLLLTIPQLIFLGSSGYADLPFTFYYFISVVFLMRALDSGLDKRFLFISSIFAGLSAWTKNEGLAVSLFNILILGLSILFKLKLSRRNVFIFLEYVLIIFAIVMPWFWLKKYLGLSNDVVNPDNLALPYIFSNLKRLTIILSYTGKSLFSFESWNLFWLLSMGVIITNYRKLLAFPLLNILLVLMLYLGTWFFIYIITPYDVNWHLATSLNRLLLHITPIVLFLDSILIFSKPQRPKE